MLSLVGRRPNALALVIYGHALELWQPHFGVHHCFCMGCRTDSFGGRSFGQGVPLAEYRQTLGDSVFALCPEGDRHFDTFRLYESLADGMLAFGRGAATAGCGVAGLRLPDADF